MVEISNRRNNGESFAERTGRKMKELISPNRQFKNKESYAGFKSSSYPPRRSSSVNGHTKAAITQVERLSHRSINDEQDASLLATVQQTIKPVTSTPPIQQIEKTNSSTPQEPDIATNTGITGNLEEQKMLQRRFTDQEELIKSLKKANEDLRQQLHQLTQDNNTLKRQCSEGADRLYNSSQTNRPLSKPNSEIIKDWNTLGYIVDNFVDNHFRDASNDRIVLWAKIQHEHLQKITKTPQDAVTSPKSGLALIKAAVWAELKRFAFGGVASEGSLRWAGDYRTDIRGLGKLSFIMRREPISNSSTDSKLKADYSKSGFTAVSPLHSQWKTLMANIMSDLEDPEQRSLEVDYVAMNIEELLAQCRPRNSNSNAYHRDLRGLVHKAIDMDLVLSGQTDDYRLHWLSGETFDHNQMMPASGSSQGSRKTVRFMIRPCLYRVDGQGEAFDDFKLVEKCTVWM
ncbi:aat family amino acid transporter [Fusarium flagelliforme]|uniref:Aat family amino acid transporter n=1 Tax=Fusarium flagelliforme TaxID=2675880 RepID=A0A395MMN6_9HYPO|nr:aat family amino acid transporter [Fusarium flagelliforme]